MYIGHVIYLSSAGCSLWSWQGRQFAVRPVRVPVGTDPAPLAAELLRLEAAPVAVLVDMTDEEHVTDVVPRLGQRDQHALLERKLARVFPRTAFRVAQIQGRHPGNTDENRVLLSALTRPEPMRLLLQRLAEARLPVAGVFSPALLSERLLDAGARAADAAMLVLRRSNGRLQHSFFRHGRLVGSRRLRASAIGVREDPDLMFRQLEESLRYFDPTIVPGPERRVLVVLPAADLAVLSTAEGRSDGWALQELDAVELRKRIGIGVEVGADASDRIFIEMLRAPRNAANFAPPADRRYFRMFRAGTYGRAACLVLAVAALAGTMSNGLAILGDERDIVEAGATMSQFEGVLSERPEAVAATVDPVLMQQAVTAYEAIRRNQAEPAQVLDVVSAAVGERSRIRVDALRWSTQSVPAEDAAVTDEEPESADEVPADEPSGSVTVTLSGHIAPFDGDLQLAFDELRKLVAALRRNPAVASVTTRVQPLDVDPASTLSGEVAGETTDAEAPFTLEIALQRDRLNTMAGIAVESADGPG